MAPPGPQPIQPTPSVAIIGGGIGGAFAAWWLRNASPAVRIDVYERSSAVGGRTLDTGEGDASVELGASMAIVQNRYVAEAATALGLSRQLRSEARGRGGGRLGIVGANGRIVFEEAPSGVQTAWRLLSRYGLRPLHRLRRRGSEFISNFSRLYEAQAAGRAFREGRRPYVYTHFTSVNSLVEFHPPGAPSARPTTCLPRRAQRRWPACPSFVS